MGMFSVNLALLFTAMASRSPKAKAHDWMTHPPPYNRVFRTRDCRGRQCTDACPPKWSGMNNSREEPAVVWKRGQVVRTTYAKNNHHGGMIRFALVPVDKMWDREWHEKMTLLYGCWDSQEYKCRNDEDCGTDKGRKAFVRKVRIPSVFPNGDYVFGFVWFGGLYYNSERGFFPDFYSCSHVRISGGRPLGGEYTANFEPGTGPKIKRGKCRTSADRVGDCEITGCPNKKSFRAIPRVFRKREPKPITPATVASGFESSSRANGDQNNSHSGGEKGLGPEPGDGSQTPGDPGYQPDGDYGPEKDGVQNMDRGICRSGICCSSSCRECGGQGCERRDGGGKNCCMSGIAESKRICSNTVGAPCAIA